MEAATEFVRLSNEMHHSMQLMIEVGLVMLGFMTIMFVIYLILGKV